MDSPVTITLGCVNLPFSVHDHSFPCSYYLNNPSNKNGKGEGWSKNNATGDLDDNTPANDMKDINV